MTTDQLRAVGKGLMMGPMASVGILTLRWTSQAESMEAYAWRCLLSVSAFAMVVMGWAITKAATTPGDARGPIRPLLLRGGARFGVLLASLLFARAVGFYRHAPGRVLDEELMTALGVGLFMGPLAAFAYYHTSTPWPKRRGDSKPQAPPSASPPLV
jgi:hypothetical protein